MKSQQSLLRILTAALMLGGATIGPSAWAELSPLEGDGGREGADLSALEGEGAAAVALAPAKAARPSLNAAAIQCPGGDAPCLEAATNLPFRVLPRPFSHLYQGQQATNDQVVQANVPAFRPLYVFAREGVDLTLPTEPAGWYRVGPSEGKPQGWMQARDVLEWRQALVVSYTHPGGELEGRKPVLMFKERGALQEVLDALDMAAAADALYLAIEQGKVPETVISMEPKRFVDITQNFYILPILDWEQTSIAGDDVRLLQLAAAVPGGRGADTLADADYRQQATVDREAAEGVALQDLKVDVVFVMDTTRSMQPYIDQTKQAVAEMTKRFTEQLKGKVRFGLVGYRDSIQAAPKLEYASKNFTPELVDGEALVKLLSDEAKATPVGSLDYAEEVFAGVNDALRSNWTEGALRFLVLVGDASSHPRGHPQNTTGKDETDLRREAEDLRVHLLAMHLQDERAREDHELATMQFTALTRVQGSADQSALAAVDAFKEGDFKQAVDALTQGILDRLTAAGQGQVDKAEAKPAAAGDQAPGRQVEEALGKVWEAALVEYLGKGANPPKDIIAWVSDRDLLNPADPALEVRVLINRTQLNNLVLALDRVVQAFMRAEVTQGQFFDALQSVSGQAMKRPEDLAKGATLAQQGLLPAFLNTLPYRSDILSLSNEMYASLTAEQRSQLEWAILAKLQQYRAINEQVDAWQRLNPQDPESDMVYPLQLDFLP
jgi:serine/threonine-protein kinase PpkA